MNVFGRGKIFGVTYYIFIFSVISGIIIHTIFGPAFELNNGSISINLLNIILYIVSGILSVGTNHLWDKFYNRTNISRDN